MALTFLHSCLRLLHSDVAFLGCPDLVVHKMGKDVVPGIVEQHNTVMGAVWKGS